MLSFLARIFFYQPIFNVLIALYHLFGNNLGWSIIVIALIAKIITIPITKKQLKSAEQMKIFQEKSKKVRQSYAKNPEKMNSELMKLSSKYMPAQLGGCLPLIITIILLVQMRGVVIDLVNRGYHAFNEVAYIESLKIPEDSVYFKPETELSAGEHKLKLEIQATNGNMLEKEYLFEIVDDIEKRVEEIKEKELSKSETERKEISVAETKLVEEQRKTDISIYNQLFEEKGADIQQRVVLSRSLYIFPKEVKIVNLLTNRSPEFNFYLRAPSDEYIDSVKVFFDEEEVTERSKILKGDSLNLNFGPIELSKVGRDFWGDWANFIPYLVMALLLGITQFGTSAIQMGLQKKNNKEKNDIKKKKNKKPDEMDMSEAMQQSSQQMVYMMPIMTVLISLGYLGGSNIFPSAVSLFWTAQNGFVIIQLAITKRDEIIAWVRKRLPVGKNDEEEAPTQRSDDKDKKSEE